VDVRRANVFDPVKKTLDPRVFKNEVPRPSVVKFIRDNIQRVSLQFCGWDATEYSDLYLTGSLTTFQYSDDSDCDVSLFVQWDLLPGDPKALRKGLVTAMVEHLDGTNVPGTSHPMQDFVVMPGIQPSDLYHSGLRSAWSFQTHDWIVPPERSRAHDVVNELPVLYHRAQLMAEKLDLLLTYNPAYAREFWHQIHKKRQREMAAGKGDFSEGNIVYKYLLHTGLFDRIEDVLGEHIAREAWTVVADDSMRWDSLDDYQGGGVVTPGDEPGYPPGETETAPQAEPERAAPEVGGVYVRDADPDRSQGERVFRVIETGAPAVGALPKDERYVVVESLTPDSHSGPRYIDEWQWNFEAERGMIRRQAAGEGNLHVIYDQKGDRIILGTPAQAAQLPGGKILGEYDGRDVKLYDNPETWLNTDYFTQLWDSSFPNRKFDQLYVDSDGAEHRIDVAKPERHP